MIYDPFDASEREYPRPASEKRLLYSDADYQSIAEAVNLPIAAVRARAAEFEVAALLYEHDLSDVVLSTPGKGKNRLKPISGAASRLLEALGVQNAADAPDGPSSEILDLLNFGDMTAGDEVVAATARVGRLVEVLDAIAATKTLKRVSNRAAVEIAHIGNLTVRKGHQAGPLSDWTAALLSTYKKLTNRKPGTSIGAPGTKTAGRVGGPLIRFLRAAGQPLEIRKSEKAWRSLVRGVLRWRQK